MNIRQSYLMENEKEGRRLLIKSDHPSTVSQLLDAGITALPDRPVIVDAGCGVGFVSKIIAEICSRSYQRCEVKLLDMSESRLAEAKTILPAFDNVTYDCVCTSLEEVQLSDDSADFVFSRFVFEYLKNQEKTFSELKRILKPGGKMVLADLDHNCMNHYPIAEKLENQLKEMTSALHRQGLFDPYAGRKLFTYFKDHGMEDIKVRMEAHHLFFGPPEEAEHFNWLAKVDQMIALQKSGVLHLEFDATEFKNEFQKFLMQENRFSYTPIIIVEGAKPK